ncbi:divalent metal cation transporter [Candidatus Micrarchaeota archaeon]|nr:divalent metal cation transporter [Candidatus Micrarchaeota archaeon]
MSSKKHNVKRELAHLAREVHHVGREIGRAADAQGRNLIKHGRMLGPGLITGAADDDAGGIATYSIVGATTGFALGWLMVLSTPMLIAVQGICAKIGNVTKKGIATLTRERYGRNVAMLSAALLVIANVAIIAADVAGMSLAAELFTGIPWAYFVIPLCLAVLYVVVYKNFNTIQKVLIYLSFVLLAYVAAGILAKPDWGEVLRQTLVPRVEFSVPFLLAAVGLLGTTITPYLFYWQTAAEIEAKRTEKQHARVNFDVITGMVYSNLVSYFIIIAAGTELYPRLQAIGGAAALSSAPDPARFIALALRPVAGDYSFYLFAIGLFAASVLAIAVLSSSTAFVVSETLGWSKGLNKRVRQARGFYGVIAASVLAGAAILFVGVTPYVALYYSQVLSGILDLPLLIIIMALATDKAVMGQDAVSGWWKRVGYATIGVIAVAVIALFYGILFPTVA